MAASTCSKKTCWDYWVVTMRRCNMSAFNGYQVNRSDYSEVTCRLHHARWRTKANYVEDLPDSLMVIKP